MFDKKEYNKKYRQLHKDEINVYTKQWRKDNPDKVKQSNKKWGLITHPKWNPITSPINNPRRLNYKGKQIYLKENPRTGICSSCGKGVGEGIKKTSIHHIQYHDDNPLKDTIELCSGCHRKETCRLRREGK